MDLGTIHLENIPKIGRRSQGWPEENPVVDVYTVACLNASGTGPVRRRHTIEAGTYYVVFDWTDNVLEKPDRKRMSAQVSVRATHSVEDQVAKVAPTSLNQLYGNFSRQPTPLMETAVIVAEDLCNLVPETLHEMNLEEINAVAPQTGYLVAGVNTLLTILADRLGFRSAMLSKLTETSSVWTRWGMSVLPVASSIDQMLDDACTVAAAKPAEVTDAVQNFLLSLGIVIADLIAAYFGVAGRVATFTVGLAHKYLLGFVARTLGLKTYLVLLRELYTLTLAGIRDVLSEIKTVTRTIARKYDWFGDEDVETVESLDKNSLRSLDLDIDWFSLSPECSV